MAAEGEGKHRGSSRGTVRRMTAKRKKSGKKSSKRKSTSKKKKTSKKKASKKKPSTRKKRKSASKKTKKKAASKKSKKKPSAKKKKRKSASKRKSSRKRSSKRSKIASMFEPTPAPPPPPPASQIGDKAIQLFEKGMKAFHKKDYEKAEAHFQNLTEGHPQEKELIARVQMYLQLCEQHLGSKVRKYKDPEDHYYRAIVLSNRGEQERALDHLDKALNMVRRRKNPELQEHQVHYVAASICSQAGELESAAEHLERAIEGNPRNRIYAINSPDFRKLRSHDGYRDLFEEEEEEPGS